MYTAIFNCSSVLLRAAEGQPHNLSGKGAIQSKVPVNRQVIVWHYVKKSHVQTGMN
jgi:hypothetical protein